MHNCIFTSVEIFEHIFHFHIPFILVKVLNVSSTLSFHHQLFYIASSDDDDEGDTTYIQKHTSTTYISNNETILYCFAILIFCVHFLNG